MNKIKFIIKTIRAFLRLIYKGGNLGYCCICERKTLFIIESEWLRDNYKCYRCASIPRQRALIDTLNRFYPNWPELTIHESSPGGVSSDFIKKKCKNYSTSHFYNDVKRGEFRGIHRSEDLSQLTFKDNLFDLFITQDVFEHVIEPQLAFKEIQRVLKPGGAHIFSMPWYPELANTRQRAKIVNNQIVHIENPVYHGNPIDSTGSLVTFDWGLDFIDIIYKSSGLNTIIYLQKDRTKGIDAEFLEIFISRKNNV